MEKIMIDAMGKQCPIPVVMMKKALDEQPQVSCAEILVDNEIAVKNLVKLANSQNCSFQWKKLEEKKYQVVLTRNARVWRLWRSRSVKMILAQPRPSQTAVSQKTRQWLRSALLPWAMAMMNWDTH